jgi:hypothetical protein
MAVSFKEIVMDKFIDIDANLLADKNEVPFEIAVWVKECLGKHIIKSCVALMIFEQRFNDRMDQQFKPNEDKKEAKQEEAHEEQTEPAGDGLFVEGDQDETTD